MPHTTLSSIILSATLLALIAVACADEGKPVEGQSRGETISSFLDDMSTNVLPERQRFFGLWLTTHPFWSIDSTDDPNSVDINVVDDEGNIGVWRYWVAGPSKGSVAPANSGALLDALLFFCMTPESSATQDCLVWNDQIREITDSLR